MYQESGSQRPAALPCAQYPSEHPAACNSSHLLSTEELICLFLLRWRQLIGHERLREWKTHKVKSQKTTPHPLRFQFCSGKNNLTVSHPFSQTLAPIGPVWTKNLQEGGGQGRPEQKVRIGRIQGNGSSHSCRQWEGLGLTRAGWARGPETLAGGKPL